MASWLLHSSNGEGRRLTATRKAGPKDGRETTLLAWNTAEVLRAAYRQTPEHHEEDGWHILRRTLATLLTGSHENAKTTQELMRRANAGITMNLYAQALTPAERAAHLKLVGLIQPATETAIGPLWPRAEDAVAVSS
jgi:hypothetical protein